MRILVVCMGNICRSPTAEAVLRQRIKQRGLDYIVDSAGTLAYHQGEHPDPRSQEVGESRGYRLAEIRARKITESDFDDFDLILAADKHNEQALLAMSPAQHAHKVTLMMAYCPELGDEIPDPYYGGPDGFELVLDLIEQVSDALLDRLEAVD
ncbi:low molecular weight protein-tyrosine-phosphatase [Thaumasiovibrio sp. DFM-14]|uniref:low molecular weight protein-tyrosine-phosphatase n=1 Tax=Thaumasiovibrio sp. DFM-14 TaxID=3384792 RepID=UPI0039A323B3